MAISGNDCKKILCFILFFLITINQASGGVDDISHANGERDIKQVSEEVDFSHISGEVDECMYKNKKGKVICPLASDVFYKHKINKINEEKSKYKGDDKKQNDLNKRLNILNEMYRTEEYSSPDTYMNMNFPFMEEMINSDNDEINKIFKKIQKEEKSLCDLKGKLSKCKNYKVDKSFSSSRSRDKRYKISSEIESKNSLINDLKQEYTNAVEKNSGSSKVLRVTGVLLPLLVNFIANTGCDCCGESTDNRHKLACLTFSNPYMEGGVPNKFYSILSHLTNEDKYEDEFNEMLKIFRENDGKIEKHTCCDCWLTKHGDHKHRDYRINGKIAKASPGFKLLVIRMAHFDVEKNKKSQETQGAAAINTDQPSRDEQKSDVISGSLKATDLNTSKCLEDNGANSEGMPLLTVDEAVSG